MKRINMQDLTLESLSNSAQQSSGYKNQQTSCYILRLLLSPIKKEKKKPLTVVKLKDLNR